ncbi:MAG TPA: hypothetical protein VK750_04800 [Cytophagaceae bacterium]|jgi:hypothetical protein|nr:hypothetical protein [Cytophagaceae bacterium]
MKKHLLLLAMLILCVSNSFAQKKSVGSNVGTNAEKNMAIGVRLGDPTGVTFKKYLGTKAALEFNAGIPTFLFGGYDYSYDYDHHYYQNGYYGYGHDRPFGLAFQAHYTRLFDIKPVTGLQWYAGGGLQMRTISYKYYYYDVNGFYRSDRATYVQFGIDALGGAEYTFKDAPFSVFADLNFYINFVNNPGLYVQPGVGGRFNF